MHTDEAASLSEIERGEFGRFYHREFDGQVRRAVLLVGSNGQANDIVQEAMLAVFRRWRTVVEPGPYLNRAVLNGCRDAGRRRSSERRFLARLRPVTSTAPHDEVLDDVLRTLPFSQRAAVVLRYYGGFSTDEIAAILDCPTGSIGPWIDRALAKMRKALQ